jgi:hypothetical protein
VTPGQAQFQLTYAVSPIILTGGIASAMPYGALPIAAFTAPGGYPGGLLGPLLAAETLDDLPCYFMPLPGSDLISDDVGTYPFANQQTAANAIITKPLVISMVMYAPVRPDTGGYFAKPALFASLQAALAQHNISGGLYTVLTPAFAWVNCVMTGFHDASGGETRQVQWRWQLDFIKPLVSLADAKAAMNSLYNSIQNGQQVTPNAGGMLTSGNTQPAVPPGTSGSSSVLVPSLSPNPVPGAGDPFNT